MTEKQLEQLLGHLTAALEIYRNHKGPLRASDISIKSMLNVARIQVTEELAAVKGRVER
jgi:hypothetical protein